ncbi:winged helix DNA-binding protein [Raineyella sp. LH-20]|uniref:winged helix DNA-binding protein n=1 Tax=Raineyella sp. LH-20 TaxID=3081204 RepID=UPI00295420E8|nr:winged helix DNA-binding protein [Raineyella sp. LH-20]WOP18256.1 winged helix DNA-binding protein [Raineyella sp. LH-20]
MSSPDDRSATPSATPGTESEIPASTWHLGRTPAEADLASLEFALMAAGAAFERYVTQIALLIGDPELTYNEIVILHVIRMYDRPKDATTIARLVNRDDLANVQYTLRKLVSVGLVKKIRSGVTAHYATTPAGADWTERYVSLRSRLLIDLMTPTELAEENLAEISRRLTRLTVLYESSARGAGILNPHRLFDEPTAEH